LRAFTIYLDLNWLPGISFLYKWGKSNVENLTHYVDNEGKIWVEVIRRTHLLERIPQLTKNKILFFVKTVLPTRIVPDRISGTLEVL
jgi:hypothetical protein